MEEDLVVMRHKRSLMKIYVKKLREMDDNITLADILHAICTDIMNDSYKNYLNVIKNDFDIIYNKWVHVVYTVFLPSWPKTFFASGC